MGMITELVQRPVVVSAVINLLVGLRSLQLRDRGRRFASVAEGDPTSPPAMLTQGAILTEGPSWLGACAGFHLISAVLFALAALQSISTNDHLASEAQSRI